MARVLQMISQHDVVSINIEKPENETRDNGEKYQTMELVIICKDKGSNFKLSFTLFSEGETIDVNIK